MAGELSEVLVIAENGGHETFLEELRARATVIQALPPRLALVALPAGADAALGAGRPVPSSLPRLPGATCYGDDLPADVLDRLTGQERLFVEAWRLRRRKARQRPGDHLPWDVPGHRPPDLPPGATP
ncbi:hypothetical protein [Streptomyces mangrovi]|uniref:hypothetical protein n=1 Tax=Streptomyces mangrovi TaxID=1206892 RepID=UPI00399C9F3E